MRRCETCGKRPVTTQFCSDQCAVTHRQIREAHAKDAVRNRTLPEAHLPYGWESRPRPTVLIAGIRLPFGELAVLRERRSM